MNIWATPLPPKANFQGRAYVSQCHQSSQNPRFHLGVNEWLIYLCKTSQLFSQSVFSIWYFFLNCRSKTCSTYEVNYPAEGTPEAPSDSQQICKSEFKLKFVLYYWECSYCGLESFLQLILCYGWSSQCSSAGKPVCTPLHPQWKMPDTHRCNHPISSFHPNSILSQSQSICSLAIDQAKEERWVWKKAL